MEERRQFYRISDTAVLSYRVVQETSLNEAAQRIQSDKLDRNNVHSLMLFMESRLQNTINRIGDDQPAIAQALDLLNKKLGLLERMLNATSEYGDKHDNLESENTQEVNLSAGGLAFSSRSSLAVGAHLELSLALLPDYRFIRAYGRVVSCRTDETCDQPFQVAVEFEYIDDEDREFLVQHIFKLQTDALRREREEREAG